uniref:Uncharacterized protein n=1 Tax=Arundo donax TaxID=35708 RepID=A0A0A9GBM2_ARUDO
MPTNSGFCKINYCLVSKNEGSFILFTFIEPETAGMKFPLFNFVNIIYSATSSL